MQQGWGIVEYQAVCKCTCAKSHLQHPPWLGKNIAKQSAEQPWLGQGTAVPVNRKSVLCLQSVNRT